MTDRLDRIERILEMHSEQMQAFSQQSQARMLAMDARMDRFQLEMEQARREANQRMDRIEGDLDENLQHIASEIGKLTRQISALAQTAEQDRNQAAIDRAEFRSTVEQLLQVLTQRFTSNGGS